MMIWHTTLTDGDSGALVKKAETENPYRTGYSKLRQTLKLKLWFQVVCQ